MRWKGTIDRKGPGTRRAGGGDLPGPFARAATLDLELHLLERDLQLLGRVTRAPRVQRGADPLGGPAVVEVEPARLLVGVVLEDDGDALALDLPVEDGLAPVVPLRRVRPVLAHQHLARPVVAGAGA